MQRTLSRAGLLCAALGLVVIFSTSTAQPHVRLTGDPNSGDVWTDNAGQPAGPGHEQDPHLSCTDINIWGSGLADSSGTYVIDGWPPSGAQETDYSANWTYNTGSGGSQVIAVVNTSQLIATAQANGDAPVNGNGYHFKLVVSQDPRKSKVFWVACGTGGGGGGGGSSTPTPTPTPGGSGGGVSTSPTPTPSGSVGGVSTTPTPTPAGSGGGTPAAGATPTPSSGVLGISTSSETPSTASETAPSGGVLGIATAVPFTGAAGSITGWLLLGIGVLLLVAERKQWLRHLYRW